MYEIFKNKIFMGASTTTKSTKILVPKSFSLRSVEHSFILKMVISFIMYILTYTTKHQRSVKENFSIHCIIIICISDYCLTV